MIASSSRVSDLQYVKGVGPRRYEALDAMGIRSVRDLLYYFPRDYLDRSKIVPIGDIRKFIEAGEYITVVGQVLKQEARRTKKGNRIIFLLTVGDESGKISCVWFEGYSYYKDAFTVGETLALSAIPGRDKLGRPQFVHPQFDRLASSEEDEPDWGKLFNTGTIIPKYRSTAELSRIGLDSRGFRRIVRNALPQVSRVVPEILDGDLPKLEGLWPLTQAIQKVHFPGSWDELAKALQRLKFDELFFLQLMLFLRKTHDALLPGIAFAGASPRQQLLRSALPYTLTRAQERVLGEIEADMRLPRPMNRLLQGDVGSGKTVVALSACLRAIDHGYQAAFMAPTEVLAEQHLQTLAEMTRGLNINVRLLIGGQRKKLREDVLEDIRRGSAQLVVGTHALLEEQVDFPNLGFVVIDEQHRFGVAQRSVLRQKGTHPDLLVMTATPIPRTLAMTLYGDLDVSTIDELPAGRKPIVTAVRTEEQKSKVLEFIRAEVGRGRQAYIIFPLIEQSEKVDLKAATEEYETFRTRVFPECSVGLLHGRMKGDAKEGVMHDFQSGKVQILVSTTVIEVGIDIPNATVMVIENAERFGLSQLHQLRGRVGRGADQSYCVLMSKSAEYRRLLKDLDPSELREEERSAERRLKTMVETNDGFRIAEVDLELRGPGELFGTRQSGAPTLTVADLVLDRDLLERARDAASRIVAHDPQLRLPEHGLIRRHFEDHYRDLFDLGSVS